MSGSVTASFAVFGGIAAVCWLLAVVEWIGTLRLSRWVFRLGPVVFRDTQAPSLPPYRGDGRDETESACWRLAGPNLCLFRYRVRPFGATLHTPFLVKGTILQKDDLVGQVVFL